MIVTSLIMSLFLGLIVAERNTLSVLQEKTERILYLEGNELKKNLHLNIFGEKFIIDVTYLYNFVEKSKTIKK